MSDRTARAPLGAARGAGLPGSRRWALLLAILAAAAGPAAAGGFTLAPPLELSDLDGTAVKVSYADARVTLVNFWATWCLPCRAEMPEIEKMVEKYGERGFRAYGIAVESGEPAQIKDFLARRMLATNYPVLLGDDATVTAYGNIQIIPTTYLIGSDGTVHKTYLGVTEEFAEEVSAAIEPFLAPAAPAAPAGEKKEAGGP